MILFFKYFNPENPGKELIIKAEVDQNNLYVIKSAKINFPDFDPLKASLVFGADEFSKTIRENGFDENDVLMELEDMIVNREKDEIV